MIQATAASNRGKVFKCCICGWSPKSQCSLHVPAAARFKKEKRINQSVHLQSSQDLGYAAVACSNECLSRSPKRHSYLLSI
jgi:hypothetical protein